MNCWHCESELIWGGDHDYETEQGGEGIVTNLSCPNCEAQVFVYLDLDTEAENETAV
jgi:hypothetical protein